MNNESVARFGPAEMGLRRRFGEAVPADRVAVLTRSCGPRRGFLWLMAGADPQGKTQERKRRLERNDE